jgi:hypothetical protein
VPQLSNCGFAHQGSSFTFSLHFFILGRLSDMVANGSDAKLQIKIPIDDGQLPRIQLHSSKPQQPLSAIPENCIVLFFNERMDQELRETTELFSGLGLSPSKCAQNKTLPFQ